MHAHAHSFLPFHTFLLLVFSLIVVGQLWRIWKLRKNIADEIAHLLCFALMIPMVVGALMGNQQIRLVCAVLAFACCAFFLARMFAGQDFLRKLLHAGMAVGMGVMYLSFQSNLLAGFFALFYFFFSAYYIKELVGLFKIQGSSQRVLYVQSKLSHLTVGISMWAMFLWP